MATVKAGVFGFKRMAYRNEDRGQRDKYVKLAGYVFDRTGQVPEQIASGRAVDLLVQEEFNRVMKELFHEEGQKGLDFFFFDPGDPAEYPWLDLRSGRLVLHEGENPHVVEETPPS